MRKILLAAALAFTLNGCAPGTVIDGPAVIAGIQQTCGIIVPIADITALVAANPALTSVAAVVNAICGAFKAQLKVTEPGGAPTGTIIVNGIIIHYTVQ